MRKLALSSILLLPLALGCTVPPAAAPDATPPAGAAAAEPAAAEPTADATDTKPQEASKPKKVDWEVVEGGELPKAEDMLAATVEALGGAKKIAGIKSYYTESKIEIPAQKVTATTKVWWREGESYQEQVMEGVGEFRVWHTKKGTWSSDPIFGKRKLESVEAEQADWMSNLVIAADWKKFFDSAEAKQRRRKGEVTVVDIELKSKSGETLTLSVDEATNLPALTSFNQASPMGRTAVTVEHLEYKDYDGFKSAAKSAMTAQQVNVESEVLKLELNPKISKKKFKPPKDVTGKK